MMRETDFIDEYYIDYDFTILKKLTLVIPTNNRNYYLSRCLWYHAHFPFGQIIVADSSLEEKKNINRETVAKISKIFGLNILYIGYEPETEIYGGDIYRKWGDAILHVCTEYSEICTDREFVNPIVCCESILFLDNHDDYVSAFGKRVNIITNQSIELENFSNMETVDDADPLNRLRYCCCKNRGISENNFHVNRGRFQKIAQNNHINHGVNDIRYGEVIAELQYYLLGKVMIFNTIGRLRDNSHMIYFNDSFQNRSESTLQNKSESSSSRYPYPNQYPRVMQKELHEKAINCLYFLLPLNKQTKKSKKVIKKSCNEIIHWWMCPNSSAWSRLNVFFWNHIPINIKVCLSKYFGSGIYAKMSAVGINMNPLLNLNYWDGIFIKITKQLLIETNNSYKNDTRIIDSILE